MITITFDSFEEGSFVKEFKQKKSAAKFMEKTFDKDTLNELTTGPVWSMTWWLGEIKCDTPFNTFLTRPVYINNEDDKPVAKKNRRR